MPMHKLTTRVTEPMRDALATEAARQGVSIAGLIRKFIANILYIPGKGRQINGTLISSIMLAEVRTFYPRLGVGQSDTQQKIKAIKAIRKAQPLLRLGDAKMIVDQVWREETERLS